ncbi:putative serine/threonine-protein kinase PBL28 [Bidens hawaiensis]|uniref:putative serine/threonine-protein kinase PBL28 n=1 Tax=Bidens hawaiensis TaxID=980011 RepID=UPI00404AB069
MKRKDEILEMPSTVAIKRIFSRDDGLGKEGFVAELDVLSRCEHPNIVSLLGFCVEGNEMLLVYEYASNGSLDDCLGNPHEIINLTWAQRLKMCIDIAHGLNYLHAAMEEKRRIIHRDIKGANILLGKNWEAKIADFGLSKFHPANQQASTINTNNIAGTNVYLDPEYAKTGRLKKASDIYSFGEDLFEIFTGKLAYDSSFIWENGNGLAPIAQRHFEKGTLKEILDSNIMHEAHELSSTLKVGPNLESLNAFSQIAYQCLAKTQADRPTIEVVIKKQGGIKVTRFYGNLWFILYGICINYYVKVGSYPENRKDTFKMSLEDIKLGVESFSDDNCITGGVYGMLYSGEVQYANGLKKVFVKRFHKSD